MQLSTILFVSLSLDCVKWGLLQLPDEETQRRCLLIKGRFIGDPSHEYDYAEKKAENEESVGLEEEENSNLVIFNFITLV